jgi:hypothetical protein
MTSDVDPKLAAPFGKSQYAPPGGAVRRENAVWEVRTTFANQTETTRVTASHYNFVGDGSYIEFIDAASERTVAHLVRTAFVVDVHRVEDADPPDRPNPAPRVHSHQPLPTRYAKEPLPPLERPPLTVENLSPPVTP